MNEKMRNNKYITTLWVTLLLLAGTAVTAAAQPVIHSATPGDDLVRLIEAAAPHDTLYLNEGLYSVSDLTITKPLVLTGSGNAILHGGDQKSVLMIRSDSVHVRNIQVHASGISFMSDNAGILVEKASAVILENLTLKENFFGIYLSESHDVLIRNNRLSASGMRETQSGNGIHLWYSKEVTITDNYITGHRDGIYFEFVEDIDIRRNISEKNLRYGQHFMFSDRCIFTENIFRNNGAGVAVMYTDQVTMTDNRFEDNWGSAAYGLLMKEIRDSKVYGNTFSNNSVGMYMEASNRNRIKENHFTGNGWALKVMANSMDNQFTANNFIDNTFEVATNSRQNFNIFSRNYWSHYKGYDLDRDGTGDVAHHPVRLFAILVEQQPEMLALMRSTLIGILDTAERIMPVLTPENLADNKPQMRRYP